MHAFTRPDAGIHATSAGLPGRLIALSVLALSLGLSACSSESDSNPLESSAYSVVGSDEPFSSTVYLDPDLITRESPTVYERAEYLGTSQRTVYDRRVDDFELIDAFIFDIHFTDGRVVEAIVNAEFGDETRSRVEVERFGRIIGQLPAATRNDIEELWVHRGRELWGSSDNALFVHSDMTVFYDKEGIAEETLLHESVHVSLDEEHEDTPGWRAAQAADNNFISTYARDNVNREDFVETFLMWVALRFRPDGVSDGDVRLIEDAVPARLQYLDQQSFNMIPIYP